MAVRKFGRRWPRSISARYLIGRHLTPVCTPGIAARLKAPSSLLKESLLHHTNYPGNWQLWMAAANVDAETLRLGSGFDLGNNLIVAACAGMGVALIQPCLVERELASGELVQPFELCVSTGRGYYLCTRKASDGKQAVEAFTRWVVEMAGTDAK